MLWVERIKSEIHETSRAIHPTVKPIGHERSAGAQGTTSFSTCALDLRSPLPPREIFSCHEGEGSLDLLETSVEIRVCRDSGSLAAA